MTISHELKQTMGEPNIWGAFETLMFEFDRGTESCGLLFSDKKFRQGPGFQEHWSFGLPLDHL
jgi:hypothetical protein